MKRLFAAIKPEPDEEYLRSLRDFRHALRQESIKWVEEHNIHITLKFFGETAESLIPRINRALSGIAGETAGFSYAMKNLGIFGSSYNPRVIWAGIEPYDELVRLMKKVQELMVPLGFPADRQNAVPHLTLGRVKFLRDRKFFQDTLDSCKGIVSRPVSADRIILFESILKTAGPEYHRVATYDLKKTTPGA